MLGQLVYLDKVEIRRIFPDKLRIVVTETVSVLAFQSENGWWLADSGGRLLEFSSKLPENTISIVGVALKSPEAGQLFSADEADISLKELLSALENHAYWQRQA
jgi:cell division septal protein FtsQ